MKSLIRAFIPTATLAVLVCACASNTKSMAEMSPDEMQTAWMKYSTPGEQHKMLEPMVGTFKGTCKGRMGPDAPWEESTGMCTNTWAMGNRFVEISYKGSWMGQEYLGHGYRGFDNSTGQYVGNWMDNMSTGLMPPMQGTYDAAGKKFTFECEYTCPITGQPTVTREVMTIKSKDEHVLDMYTQMGDEPEFHSMTITFKRG